MATADNGASEFALLRIVYVKGLAAVLQATKSGAKQVCSLTIASEGLTMRWEDDSKALQCSVYLKPELFVQYRCQGPRKTCGVQFSLLLDTLNVFASAPGTLDIIYPGANGEVVCEMKDSSCGVVVCTYARINGVEAPVSKDLEDYWEGPASMFLTQGSLLKEVIEDLEWPAGDVELVMNKDPAKLSFAARHTGALEIDLPISILTAFECKQDQLAFTYKYKALRTAFCNLPAKEFGNISTKVSIDANGLLKVTHMIGLQPQPAHGGPGHARMEHGSALLESQRDRSFDTAKIAVVTFVILPALEGQ